jgi:hypothetical protein
VLSSYIPGIQSQKFVKLMLAKHQRGSFPRRCDYIAAPRLRSSCAPAAPISLKPAKMITAPPTTVRPAPPLRSVAPITAIDFGRKITSSGFASPRST